MVASTVSVSRWVDVVSNKKMARQQNNLVVVEMDHGSLLRPCLLTSPRLLILGGCCYAVNSSPLGPVLDLLITCRREGKCETMIDKNCLLVVFAVQTQVLLSSPMGGEIVW